MNSGEYSGSMRGSDPRFVGGVVGQSQSAASAARSDIVAPAAIPKGPPARDDGPSLDELLPGEQPARGVLFDDETLWRMRLSPVDEGPDPDELAEEYPRSNWFWPVIPDTDAAKRAAAWGVGLSLFFTVVCLALAGVVDAGILSLEPLENSFAVSETGVWVIVVAAAIYLLIAWGIYHMSRVAAVVAVVVELSDSVELAITLGRLSDLFRIPTTAMTIVFGVRWLMVIAIQIAFVLIYIHALRGTFAYHRLARRRFRTMPGRARAGQRPYAYEK
jgi:hypothetical protein